MIGLFFIIPLSALTIYFLYKEYTDPIREPTKEEMEERARKLRERFAPKEEEKETSES